GLAGDQGRGAGGQVAAERVTAPDGDPVAEHGERGEGGDRGHDAQQAELFAVPLPRPTPVRPPLPSPSVACTICQPAPEASARGSRKVVIRCSRYGSNMIIAPAASANMAAMLTNSRSGVPATSSSPQTITAIAIAVPRSGSTTTRAQISRATAPTGLNSCFSERGGRLRPDST